MDTEENLQATVRRLALNLQATEQALSEARAELAHCRPVADAARAYCAEVLLGGGGVYPRQIPELDALVDAHRATTPSKVPSSHVIVERAELERLEAIEAAVHLWTNFEIDDRALVEAVARADGA